MCIWKMNTKVLCVLCASSLPFLFSINGDFIFDDSEAVIKNPDVFSGFWTDVFKHDFWGTNIKMNYSHKSYRPLTVLTFRLNYFLNNKQYSAWRYKLTNLLLHVTCSIIVWKAMDGIINDIYVKKFGKWYKDRAFVAALLFAVHPVHTEAVSGIVGRADVLAGNLFFLALICYRKAMIPSKLSYFYLLSTLVMGIASMLCKENGITVLGFCFCFELIMKFKVNRTVNRKPKQILLHLDLHSILRLTSTLVTILVCLYGRWKVMGGTTPKFQEIDNPAAFSNNLFIRFSTYNYYYFLNLLLLVWPQWLCYDWSMGCVPNIKDVLDHRLILIALIYVYGVLAFKTLFNQKIKKTTKRSMTIAILLGLIPFLPASNLFYTVGFVLAERVLYISSAGFCLLIAIGMQKLNILEKHKKYKVVPILFCFLIVVFGVKSFKRADQWRTEFQLFTNGLSVCPENAKIHYNVAKAVDTINKQWAIEEYNEAIRLYPNYYQALNNLGNLLKSEKRYAEAEVTFKTALKIKHDFPTAWMNLGILLSTVERYNESEIAYSNALRHRKTYAECFFNLGNLYLQTNQTEKALQSWLQAIRLNSTFNLAWFNLLTLLYDTGQLERGHFYVLKAIEALPNTPNIYFSAGNIYGKANNYEEAEKHFKKAIELLGSDVKAIHYGNLGVLYHRWKRLELAMEMYKKALEIDPNYATGRKYLEKLEKLFKTSGLDPKV